MVRAAKSQPSSSSSRRIPKDLVGGSIPNRIEPRVLRSRYLAVKNQISDQRENIAREDSDQFNIVIGEVESLHQHVQFPREQVADAEALLDITNTIVTSVKAHGDDGITPSDFVNCILKDFGQQGGTISSNMDEISSNIISWKDIGSSVSHIFRNGHGCSTMLGPMKTEMKQRKVVVHRKRTKPEKSVRPEELESAEEEKTDTDKNMSTMFNALRKHRKVRLENLILNRGSFAQTVENLFALSFLVKDGRAEVKIDENGHHLVSPKNAPSANAVASGEVSYDHFVFRFDFRDWKLMIECVGEESVLMPHRKPVTVYPDTQQDYSTESRAVVKESQPPTTPIRKLSRNRGLVLQEQIVQDSPESDDQESRAAAIRKGKRKLIE